MQFWRTILSCPVTPDSTHFNVCIVLAWQDFVTRVCLCEKRLEISLYWTDPPQDASWQHGDASSLGPAAYRGHESRSPHAARGGASRAALHGAQRRYSQGASPQEQPQARAAACGMEPTVGQEGCGSCMLMEDSTVWKGLMVEQFVKKCSAWEGRALQQTMKDYIL